MKKLEQFIIREIAGDFVMMPTGQTALRFNGLVMANSVSAFIWNHIEEVNTAEEMAALIVENFEVSEEQALTDTKELFNEMLKAGWIG